MSSPCRSPRYGSVKRTSHTLRHTFSIEHNLRWAAHKPRNASHRGHYDWPGNVRELENEIERVVVMSGPLVTEIGPDMLSPHIRMRPLLAPRKHKPKIHLPEVVEKLERAMILDELVKQDWNKTRAAKALGISRRNLIRKCSVYGFDKDTADR